jgi:uncharacterized protein YdaU (DUF1376 family)
MNYYPFHIGDYTTNTRHLDLIEDAIYRRLIDLYYLKDGQVTNDIDQLARLICAVPHRDKVESVISEFFNNNNGLLVHSRCDDEIAKFNSKIEKARASGQASANARKANAMQTLNERSTDVQQSFNDRSTDVQLSNNQEPITNNQEPLHTAQPSKTRAKKTVFTAPTVDDVIAYAKSRSRPDLAKAFFDYYDAGSWVDGKGSSIQNWKQKFITWENKNPLTESQKRTMQSTAGLPAGMKVKDGFLFDQGMKVRGAERYLAGYGINAADVGVTESLT